MRIHVSPGHTRNTDNASRLREHLRCDLASLALLDLLERAGHDPVTCSDDLFDLDNDTALAAIIDDVNRTDPDLAISLHLNAGGGNYSTAIYWSNDTGSVRSEVGQLVATSIADQFRLNLPWRSAGAKPRSYFVDADGDARPMGFLERTQCPSVIVEPSFKDTPRHSQWIDSDAFPSDYASMIYLGVSRWARGQG